MTQFNLIVNSLPRDLLEFVFFIAVGYTAGSIGIIWILFINLLNDKVNLFFNLEIQIWRFSI